MLSFIDSRAGILRRTSASIVALALVGVVLAGCEQGNPVREHSGSDDRRDFFSASDLVDSSQAIVVGRIVQERDEKFEFRSSSTGSIVAGLTEHVLTVEVETVLKGEIQPGDTIAVMQTSENSKIDRFNGDQRSTLEVLTFERESQYVFFLRRVVMPPEFKGAEASTWGRPGEPGFARLEGNVLQFVSTSRYREAVQARGLDLVDQGSPFKLELAALEQLAGND